MASRIAVMDKGILQQLDTPQHLYDKPNNLFVAGFIGSPAMNFFPAHLRKDGNNLFIDAGEISVKIPEAKKKVYLSLPARKSFLGSALKIFTIPPLFHRVFILKKCTQRWM